MMNKIATLALAILSAFAGQDPFNTNVTNLVAMTVKIGEEVIAKPIVIGLFGQDTPYTTENFYRLCTDDKLFKDGVHLTYKNSIFHRIIPRFMIQGGDFTNRDGTGGRSIYGEKFPDENLKIDHDVGVLSMANSGKNTNGSQFFITTVKTDWLDGKHVVFGAVVNGMDTVYEIEKYGSSDGTPRQTVTVVDCYDPTQ